jgi:acyl-CoA thioesterase FadM
MARNEIDYIKSAHLYDKLIVFTKIDNVSKSSFRFEHLVQRVSDGKEIAKGRGILVHINKKTMKSCPLPEEFHIAVLDYERV